MAQPRPATSTALDDQLCFALYTASRAMTGCYRSMLDTVGLTYPQYLVMLLLWERAEATVTGIGQALQLETGTLSPLLKRLEATGLITRSRQVDDERSVLVALTGAGRDLEEQVSDIQRRAVAATGLTRGDLVELRDSLNRLTGRLRSATRTA